MGTEGHSDNTRSRAVPLVLEQPLFKHDPFKNIKLKYFLLSVQKIVKFNWVQHHSKLKEVFCLLPSKGQLSLTIKLGFSTHSRNVEDQNIDLSLNQFTTAEAYRDDCRLTCLQFNWHQFSSTGGKQKKGRIACSQPTYYRIVYQ